MAKPPPEEAQEPPAEATAQETEKVATVGQPARDGNFEFLVTASSHRSRASGKALPGKMLKVSSSLCAST